jgi:hypothetical protein
VPYYLVDFTRGVGFSHYRRLTVQPRRDLCATFSSLPNQPRILYIHTGTQLVRYDTQAMQLANQGFFPRAFDAYGWLHQDKNDVWFVGKLDAHTVFAFNARTGQYLTHGEAWEGNYEPRLERDGRYVGLTPGSPGPFRVWDLLTNSFGPVQTNNALVSNGGVAYFSHQASLRGFWVTDSPHISAPFAEDRYDVRGGQLTRTQILANSGLGTDMHHAGNWIQPDSELGGNLTKQWVYLEADGPEKWSDLLLWDRSLGLLRSDGSDVRLLAHHYSTNITYWDYPFVLPSPDGRVVIFNSNMNGSGRYDLFVAEVPLRADP